MTTSKVNIESLLKKSKDILYSEIKYLLSEYPITCPRLREAISYSLLNQGKCIRSALVFYTGKMFNANLELLKKAMLAVELIHTYSLVHDDLPAMDNSDLRRGMATSHVKFDEATAILVGDGLQTLAFEQLANLNIDHKAQIKMLQVLASSSGLSGMVGGQSLDINNKVKSLEDLNVLHNLKTGALISASILLGALADPNNTDNNILLDQLSSYGKNIGLSFQIVDDILDIEQSTEVLGKPQNLDKAKEIPTYPELIGSIEKAKAESLKLIESSNKQLEKIQTDFNISSSDVYPLYEIAKYLHFRNN